MTFRVGQKVECVDGRRINDSGLPIVEPMPTKGVVYTVARVHATPRGLSLEIDEVPSPGTRWHYPGFAAERFRPVVDTSAGFQVLASILDSVNRKQPVEA